MQRTETCWDFLLPNFSKLSAGVSGVEQLPTLGLLWVHFWLICALIHSVAVHSCGEQVMFDLISCKGICFGYKGAASSVGHGDEPCSWEQVFVCETQSQQAVSSHQGQPRASQRSRDPLKRRVPRKVNSMGQLVRICVLPPFWLCVHAHPFVERLGVGARAIITILFRALLLSQWTAVDVGLVM